MEVMRSGAKTNVNPKTDLFERDRGLRDFPGS